MKIQGRQDFKKPFNVVVYVDGKKLYPDYSCKIINHSPSGFQWGYSGSGPAQLALALLLLVTDETNAQKLHQSFKREFIATLIKDENFDAEIDIENWVKEYGYKIDKSNFMKGFAGKDEEEIGECTFPDRCQKADWKYCDCACGGVNHGIQTKLFN